MKKKSILFTMALCLIASVCLVFSVGGVAVGASGAMFDELTGAVQFKDQGATGVSIVSKDEYSGSYIVEFSYFTDAGGYGGTFDAADFYITLGHKDPLVAGAAVKTNTDSLTIAIRAGGMNVNTSLFGISGNTFNVAAGLGAGQYAANGKEVLFKFYVNNGEVLMYYDWATTPNALSASKGRITLNTGTAASVLDGHIVLTPNQPGAEPSADSGRRIDYLNVTHAGNTYSEEFTSLDNWDVLGDESKCAVVNLNNVTFSNAQNGQITTVDKYSAKYIDDTDTVLDISFTEVPSMADKITAKWGVMFGMPAKTSTVNDEGVYFLEIGSGAAVSLYKGNGSGKDLVASSSVGVYLYNNTLKIQLTVLKDGSLDIKGECTKSGSSWYGSFASRITASDVDASGYAAIVLLAGGDTSKSVAFSDISVSGNVVPDVESIALDKTAFGDVKQGDIIDLSTQISPSGLGYTYSITAGGGFAELIENDTKLKITGAGEITLRVTADDDAAIYDEVTFTPVSASKILMTASYGQDDVLTVSVDGSADYSYQYWVKELVLTDNNDSNTVTNQYIWQVACVYEAGKTSFEVQKASKYLDENDNYNILVRYKDSSGVVGSIYGMFSQAETGKTLINTVKVNGLVYENVALISSDAVIEVTAQNADDGIVLDTGKGTYAFLEGKVEIDDIGSYESGYYNFKITASNGADSDTKTVKVFISAGYDADKTPVITGVSGSGGADTEFTVTAALASGSDIALQDAGDYTVTLTTGGTTYTAQESDFSIADGKLTVKFDATYTGTGIYEVFVRIARKDISGVDDMYIYYYDGYRAADSEVKQRYTAESGTYTITAYDAQAGGQTSGLRYAFYREDASGWVLVQGYEAERNTFVWKPTRDGTYVIQARIMGDGSGSYEAAATLTYTVGGTISNKLSVLVYDEAGELCADGYTAGNTYMIKAAYLFTEGDSFDVLYRFTIYHKNIGTVYLTEYSVNGDYVFAPVKSGSFVITVRAISSDNYGALDVSKGVTLDVSV